MSPLKFTLNDTILGHGNATFAGGKFREVQLGQKVAIYCRVSTTDQSCERQEWELRRFAERADFDVVGIWKEVASGGKDQRPERKKVMALAQKRAIDAILVTELTRWGRSTLDLVQSIHELQAWQVSLIAQTGLQFDVRTPQGKLVATLMAGLAEFERDLLRERVKSGIMAAQARGVVFGRRLGQRVKSDKLAPKVMALVATGQSYRQIGRQLDLSKNTVMEIVKRERGMVGQQMESTTNKVP
jgi:DNA invertase Pin-like site-specific DNA recombinase